MSTTNLKTNGCPEIEEYERPPPNKWIFSKEEMRQSASQKDGMSQEDELSYRQQATSFIQEMAEMLNRREHRLKITQLGMCVANVMLHRFSYFHSFKKIDYRDMAAACLFVAGKNEESPRKLCDVVHAFKMKKLGNRPVTQEWLRDATQLIVILETTVLQTISFDVNVDLPHAHVIRIMEKFEQHALGKRITSCAYYFATDVLCVTNWALRYPYRSIAVAVCYLVSIYANVDIESLFPENERKTWFLEYDPEMTKEILKEMVQDFLEVYASCKNYHYVSKISFNMKTSLSEDAAAAAAASAPKKVEMSQYRERQREVRANPSSPRQSFMPDLQNVNCNVPDSTNGSRSRYEEHKRREEKSRSYGMMKDEQFERLDRERGREDESRKRERDRIAGRQDQSTSSEKRSRIGPLSTNFVSSTSSNGYPQQKPSSSQNSSSSSSYAPHSNSNTKPPVISSTEQLEALTRKPEKPLSPIVPKSSSKYEPTSTLTPPPLPPPIRFNSTSGSDMDLEDGELE